MTDENKEKVFTVSEFIDSINVLIKKKAIVQGEIGEKIDRYPRFSFLNLLDRDKEAVLKCFVWQDRLNELGIEIKTGMEVKVEGFPEVFKKRGDFTFQVEKVGLVGEGALKRAFEILKKKLAQVGFFDPARKKSISRFCQKIGVITSKYGKGALPDFLKHLGSFGFEIYFYDVRVEGLSSIDDIVKAIHWFNENLIDIDVLVLIRGGGSWESLQSFNSEPVAKAIFGSKIPIICGVGHESDETIADWVADLRASTPTQAATILNEPWKLASSQIVEFEKNIISSVNKIYKNINGKIDIFEHSFNSEIMRTIKLKGDKLNYLTKDLNFYFQKYFEKFNKLENEFLNNFQILKSVIKEIKFRIQQSFKNLNNVFSGWLAGIESLIRKEGEKLNMVNPELLLKQGYSLTFDEFSGKIIKSIKQIKIGKNLRTKFYKGAVSSKVEKILKK